jgi:hypothetical protein
MRGPPLTEGYPELPIKTEGATPEYSVTGFAAARE